MNLCQDPNAPVSLMCLLTPSCQCDCNGMGEGRRVRMPLWELSCWWRLLWLQRPVHSLWLASGPRVAQIFFYAVQNQSGMDSCMCIYVDASTPLCLPFFASVPSSRLSSPHFPGVYMAVLPFSDFSWPSGVSMFCYLWLRWLQLVYLSSTFVFWQSLPRRLLQSWESSEYGTKVMPLPAKKPFRKDFWG